MSLLVSLLVLLVMLALVVWLVDLAGLPPDVRRIVLVVLVVLALLYAARLLGGAVNEIAAIVTLAVLVEAVIELFVPTFPVAWKWTKTYLSAALAVGVCLSYSADLPAALGLPSVPVVGPILTGLVIGRGANFVSLLFKRAQIVSAPAQDVDSVPPAPSERMEPPL